MSPEPTRYRVECPVDGGVYLTKEEFLRQLDQADATWECPLCHRRAEFDDQNWDDFDYEEE